MQVSSPFDTLAQTYDADFTRSAIGRMQRRRVWSYVVPLLNESGRALKILEINCGTGEDAIKMAMRGHKVIATDASAAMIQKANEKISGSTNPAAVEFVVSPFDQLANVFANEQFDLVFSNFGGLNCIDKNALKQLSKDLSVLIKPGGYFFSVIMGRCCVREIWRYGIRGKFKTAFRRFKTTINFTVNDKTIPVYYYSPGEVKKIFEPLFSAKEKHPVGLFIPPSYLEKKFAGRSERLNRLEKMEKRFGYSFLSSFSDHYCIIFKKEGTSA
jgi:ubiquinone/menaquinone biosynthesis C-methylase UbiE